MAPPRPVLLEVCVDHPEALRRAQAGGADRIELCSRLDLDGLSPDSDLLAAAHETGRTPIVVMVRPRPGPFQVTAGELGLMEAQVRSLRDLAPAGVVLGAITADGRVDRPALERLVAAAGGLPVVFHRAFDRCADLPGALEVLIELGVRRVLTSGGAPTAWEGRAMLRTLVERAAGRIEILAGGGIRPHNLTDLLAATGVEQVHASVPLRPTGRA
jgi:copper homeostasis protein